MADATTTIRIGPADHGRRMSFDDFRDAEPEPGHRYELARGVIELVDVPSGDHADVTCTIRRKLDSYWEQNVECVRLIASGAECRIEAPALQSERHPDCAIYVSPRPPVEPPWGDWIPEIVIEVVSKGGEKRDYEDKRKDYFVVGVKEYWIVDPQKRTMLVLIRRGDNWAERTLDATGVYQTPRLPGFALRLTDVFAPLDSRKD